MKAVGEFFRPTGKSLTCLVKRYILKGRIRRKMEGKYDEKAGDAEGEC